MAFYLAQSILQKILFRLQKGSFAGAKESKTKSIERKS
nr:MAG TPA: hypothetical protein [Caudoviricetes sp.]